MEWELVLVFYVSALAACTMVLLVAALVYLLQGNLYGGALNALVALVIFAPGFALYRKLAHAIE